MSTEKATTTSNHFEEWEARVLCDKVDGKQQISFEKMKRIRPVVKIRIEEARVLNEGMADGGNRFVKIYLRPGQKEIFTPDEIQY